MTDVAIWQYGRWHEAPVIEARDVADVLGGRPVFGGSIRNFSDLAAAISAGLPGAAMRALLSSGDSTAKEISESVRIPARSLARMQTRKRLSPDAGDKLYRLAFVIAMATNVLGSRANAQAWLRRPNRALGKATPLSLLGTQPGLRQIERELGRIQYGEIS